MSPIDAGVICDECGTVGYECRKHLFDRWSHRTDQHLPSRVARGLETAPDGHEAEWRVAIREITGTQG